MNERKNNYRRLDYQSLRTNADEYLKMKAAVAAANGSKKKLKVVG